MTSFATRLAHGLIALTGPLRRRHHARLDRFEDRLLRDVGLARIDVEVMRRM